MSSCQKEPVFLSEESTCQKKFSAYQTVYLDYYL